MEWKLDDSRPIWPQLKEQLVIAIVAGEYEMWGSFSNGTGSGGGCRSKQKYHAERLSASLKTTDSL